MLYRKISRAWVLDSLDKHKKEYEDILKVIQCGYRYYVEKLKGPHEPKRRKNTLIKTNFPVR